MAAGREHEQDRDFHRFSKVCAPESLRPREFGATRLPYQKRNLFIMRITFRNASAGEKKAPAFFAEAFL